MSKLIIFVALCLCVIIGVNGHAKLNSPTAWNPQPSKTSPCGGGAALTAAAATWTVGSTQTVVWQVVAGDGIGAVTMTLGTDNTAASLTGGVSVDLSSLSGVTPSTVTTYQMTFTVPSSFSCSNAVGCAIQFKSTSAWYACSTIKIAATAPPPVPTATGSGTTSAPVVGTPQCQTVTGLRFCTMFNSKTVAIPYGQTPTGVDNAVATIYNFNLNNPNVFISKATPGCASAYWDYTCASSFLACDNTNRPSVTSSQPVCSTVCVSTQYLCNLNASHTNLLDCANNNLYTSDAVDQCQQRTQNHYTAQLDAQVPSPTLALQNAASPISVSFIAIAIVIVITIFNILA